MTETPGVVDFHTHYYPPDYLLALASDSAVRITTDVDGNPCLHYPGDYNVAVRGHRDLDYRAGVLEREAVDVQVLTLTTPGTHVERPARALALARLVNDSFAAATRHQSRRFSALATLPLNDPLASADELERAVRELGLPGAMVFGNVNGTALHDDRFLPLWERADALEAVIHIHPTAPPGVEAMTDFWIMPLVGFLFDTTLAAAGLVFRGIPARFPRIRWVLAHLGGAVPYIAERLDRGYDAFPECRAHLGRPPSHYLREFHYDGVNFDPHALRLAIDFAGVDHVLAGSDYPHRIGSLTEMKDVVTRSEISEEERRAVLGGNAAKLLGLYRR